MRKSGTASKSASGSRLSPGGDDAYAPAHSETSAKLPKTGIWIEPLTAPATVDKGDVLLPRIFRLPAGQLVCRVNDAGQAAMFLTLLRQVPELTDSGKTDMTAMTEGKPGIHQRYHFDMAAYDTVLTKIGLNLVAKLLGVPLIRNPAFDSAVTYARDGVRSNSPTPLARRLSTVMSWR